MKKNLPILVIIALSFFLRFWKVDTVPPGLGNDEISIAYEAYSIANTGKDSKGVFLPLSFESNGSFKAPLYIYIAAPFIKIFGNNEIAVRLPSVILGTLTVFFLYLLVLELTKDKKLAILSALLLGITPWHVYTSRIALESNAALFLTVTGIVFFLKGLKKTWYLYLSPIFLGLSLYTYQTQMVFAPAALLFLSIFFFRKISIRKIAAIWVIFLLLLTPFLVNTFIFGGENRASQTFILNDYQLVSQTYGVGNVAVKVYTITVFCLNKFLEYINPAYIFIHGLPISAPYGSPYFGLLNILELPFFLIGLYFILKFKNKTASIILLSWFAAGPLISSLTLGELNLVRNLISIIPLTIISAYGIISILPKKNTRFFRILILAAIFINFAYFYRYYTRYFPFYHAENWSYGFKEIAEYVGLYENKYDKIIISHEYGRDRKLYGAPSLFVLYYNKIDPQRFLEKSKDDGYLVFEKYEFRTVDWPKENIKPNTLYVVSVMSKPLHYQKVKEVHSISLPEGEKAFSFYESY